MTTWGCFWLGFFGFLALDSIACSWAKASIARAAINNGVEVKLK